MNKWMIGIIATLVIFMLAGCGSYDEGDNGASEGKEPIKVVTEAGFMPFSYLDKGELVGFDIELIDAVLKEAGIEYTIENVGWESMLAAVQNKDADLAIAGITVDDDRKQTYDFSSSYFESTHKVVFREGEAITSGEDIKELKVGVQAGTTGSKAAEKIMGENHPNISKYDSNTLAFMSLQSGDVDAVVTDNIVADEYVNNNPDANVEMITDPETFDSEFYGIMFPKGSELVEQVNTALQTLMENGTYEELYKKWFDADPNMDALQ